MNKATKKTETSSQRAANDLRALIFSGDLAPGSTHLESELATRLNMSRTPVREAALALAAQGLLELRPRKGIRILPIAPDDMREIYEVLTALEGIAAYNAAHAGYGPDDLNGLAQAIHQMEAALEADDLPAWAEADDQFHAELVRLGGNSRIIKLVSMMADQVRRARAVTLFMRETPHGSNRAHRNLLEAIRNAQPEEAQRIHQAHRKEAQTTLLALLDKHQLRHI